MIPNVELIGYCNNCGKSIYPADFIRTDVTYDKGTKEVAKIYRCLHCKEEVSEDELIPF